MQLSLMSKPISSKAFEHEAKVPEATWLPDMLARSKIKSLATGYYHSLAADDQGHCYSWGGGENGTLGYGHAKLEQAVPRRILKLPSVKQVAVGRYHSLALTTEGEVFVWGSTKNGKLGLPNKYGQHLVQGPVKLESVGRATLIAAGQAHSMAVTESDEVWVWGQNKMGQLGMEPSRKVYKPTMNKQLSGHKFSSLSCPFEHCVAMGETKGKKMLFAWGKEGLLGPRDGSKKNWEISEIKAPQTTRPSTGPMMGASVAADEFSAAVAGCTHSVALRTSGSYQDICTWGMSEDNAQANVLGRAHQTGLSDSDVPCALNEEDHLSHLFNVQFKVVAAFQFHSLAITNDDLVYSWGVAGLHRLGRTATNKTPAYFPHQIDFTKPLADARSSGLDIGVDIVAAGYAQSLVSFTAHVHKEKVHNGVPPGGPPGLSAGPAPPAELKSLVSEKSAAELLNGGGLDLDEDIKSTWSADATATKSSTPDATPDTPDWFDMDPDDAGLEEKEEEPPPAPGADAPAEQKKACCCIVS